MDLLSVMEFVRRKCDKRFCIPKILYCKAFCAVMPADRRLLDYKDKHKGERCFIIGTAPSLKLDDIELLHQNGEITFSCNSIIKLFDKTQWRPTYFMLFDPYFYSLFHDEIDRMETSELFYNQLQIPKVGRQGIPVKCSMEHLVAEYMKGLKKKPYLRFKNNLMKKMIGGQSTIHSAVIMATWMGFRDIYLLGVDCDYSQGQHAEGTEDKRLMSNIIDGLEMIQDFKDLLPQLEEHGYHLRNCSRGNKLKVLPYIDLESVLELSRKGMSI